MEYTGDDVEELPTLIAGQGSKRARKQPSHSKTLAVKKRKGGPIEYMTDAIMEFTNISRKRRSNKDSDSRKETFEYALVGDRFSMDKAVTIFNNIENVDNYTMFKVLNELHTPDSKAVFIMLRPNRKKGFDGFIVKWDLLPLALAASKPLAIVRSWTVDRNKRDPTESEA
ncbi:hypothetical protein CFP56_037477 [Quercus suber]|uniref:Uncharacterized protein n=1 Tax=Quercus suber TaxID=58331 RepID=A0AAW0J575_QUESU